MSEELTKSISKVKGDNSIKMGAKIANQINTNQQSNVSLSALCVTTQSCSTVNINFG